MCEMGKMVIIVISKTTVFSDVTMLPQQGGMLSYYSLRIFIYPLLSNYFDELFICF